MDSSLESFRGRFCSKTGDCVIVSRGFVLGVCVAVLGKAAMSSGNFLPSKVSLEMRSSLMSLAMSYDLVQPKMTDILLPSTGHVFVMASGSSFGCNSLSHSNVIGFASSQSSVWSSDSSVVSLSSRGSASKLTLLVSAIGTGSVSLSCSYEVPVVSSSVFNSPASGSVSLSIFGTFFSVGNSIGVKSGSSSVSVSA